MLKTNQILLYWVPANSLSFAETYPSATVFHAVCVPLLDKFHAATHSESVSLFEHLASCRTYAKRTSRSDPLPCSRWHVPVPLSVGRYALLWMSIVR